MEMRIKEDSYDVGVIVGRFQVPDLHKAHKALIQHVCSAHHKVIIFLGLSPLMVTQENPLDFEARKQMILEVFPDVIVLYAKDLGSDEVWSKRLDEQIQDVVTPSQTVLLYGGRDSFIEHYTTKKYPTRELEQDVWVSGAEIRKAISRRSVKASPDFRAGVVWASLSRFPTAYPCVDVAIFNEDYTKLLLGRKPEQKKFQLIGGFADPTSPSYEADARREAQEEAGIEITDPVYVASQLVDDWRYEKEVDKIKSLLFIAKMMYGSPRPDDDIAEVRWFDTYVLVKDLSMVRDNHKAMVNSALSAALKQ